MIHTICQLHYLSEHAYRSIAGRFGLEKPYKSIGDNHVTFPGELITGLHFFNIQYEAFGHIWFMRATAEYPRFQCAREEFLPKLYQAYARLFGEENMGDIPKPREVNCDYVEYSAMLDMGDAGSALAKLASRLSPEQLDKTQWGQYKKPHSTAEFLAAKADETHLEVLARCHGPALKRIVKDQSLHLATGLSLPVAVSAETEEYVLKQLITRNMKDIEVHGAEI